MPFRTFRIDPPLVTLSLGDIEQHHSCRVVKSMVNSTGGCQKIIQTIGEARSPSAGPGLGANAPAEQLRRRSISADTASNTVTAVSS